MKTDVPQPKRARKVPPRPEAQPAPVEPEAREARELPPAPAPDGYTLATAPLFEGWAE